MGRILCMLTLLLVSMPLAAQGQNGNRTQRFGDYTLHYNAVATAMLQPEIAQRYGVVRSRRRGLLIVALRRDGSTVPASLVAQRDTPSGEMQAVELRAVDESESVYYIGEFRAHEEEVVTFRIEASPANTDAGPFSVRYQHTFFGNP